MRDVVRKMGKCVLSLLIVEVEEFLGPSCGVC